MHCCLMDSGTWSWQAVISSLIQYHLFLYALSSSFTRKQGAICSEEPKPYLVSEILCFPLNSTAFNLETIPQSFFPKSSHHVKVRHTALFYQNITRFVVSMTTCNTDIQMLIRHSASWGSEVELPQEFLVLLPKWKML